jgi:hypothetical protein
MKSAASMHSLCSHSHSKWCAAYCLQTQSREADQMFVSSVKAICDSRLLCHGTRSMGWIKERGKASERETRDTQAAVRLFPRRWWDDWDQMERHTSHWFPDPINTIDKAPWVKEWKGTNNTVAVPVQTQTRTHIRTIRVKGEGEETRNAYQNERKGNTDTKESGKRIEKKRERTRQRTK